MDDYESNYIGVRTILGSCLSNVNRLLLLWYYGILSPEEEEEEEECSLSFLSDLTIVQLK